MSLYALTPFALDRNLGGAYNEAMALLPDDGWAILTDHDALWTTREWYRQISEAVAFQPRAMFFAMCNRIAAPWQRIGPADIHDMAVHRAFGKERLQTRTLLDITHTKGAGGVVMVVSKAAWREVGGFVDGMFCVDHNMHFAHADVGRPVYLIEGLYLYHWRRAHGDTLVEEPKAPCRCRGYEPPPTERLLIP